MGGSRIALVTFAALAVHGVALAEPTRASARVRADGAAAGVERPAGSDPGAARKWLTTARQLVLRAGHLAAMRRVGEARAQLEQAVAGFHRAFDAGGDLNIYAELANAEALLGRPHEAVKHLRLVVAAAAAVRPDVRNRAASKLEELSAKVGLVTLTVSPAGASITLSGRELGEAPLPAPLVLLPGTYRVSFQADGFQPREAELKVEAGSETERRIELEPVRVSFAPVAPTSASGAVPSGATARRSPLPLFVGAGLAGAAAVSAGVFGLLAVREHTTFSAASTSSADREDARTRGKRFALFSDISLGTAVLAAGFTAYWYLARYRQAPANPEQSRSFHVEAKVDVIPWVQSASGGVTIAGWF